MHSHICETLQACESRKYCIAITILLSYFQLAPVICEIDEQSKEDLVL